ncbi:MAG: hypothetical protein IKJ81_04285 [Bacteroidales bacterium]|nr:hypothetical protein [Bacteroidales bacterium]
MKKAVFVAFRLATIIYSPKSWVMHLRYGVSPQQYDKMAGIRNWHKFCCIVFPTKGNKQSNLDV